MKIILRQDTAGLGKKGDTVDVADGYGRNYLVPNGLALLASDGAQAQAQAMRRARDLKDARDRESAETAAGALATRPIAVEARAGAEGKLFGSIGVGDIADAILSQVGVTVDRRRVSLDEPIRSLGRYEVPVRLHPEVEATVVVEVTSPAP